MRKKLSSLLLMTAWLFSLAIPTAAVSGPGITANTDAGTVGLTLEVGSAEGKPGDTVDIPVALSNNSGVAAFALKLRYDPSMLTPLSMTSGAAGPITSNIQSGSGLSDIGFVSAVWISPSDFAGTGVIFTVKFRIGASAAGDIPLTLTYDADGIVNQNYENLDAEITNGHISVTEVAAPAPPGYSPAPGADSNGSPRPISEPRGTAESMNTESADNQEAKTGGGGSPGATAVWRNPFKDVFASDWFYGAVRYVCENKLLNGMSADSFEPRAPLSRAMFAVILHRLAKEPTIAADPIFPDVAAGQWYTNAVAWAYQSGVMVGYGGLFGPGDSITREQMAAVLFRYAGDKNPIAAAGLEEYSDWDQISAWALPAMEWAVARRIITGRTASELAPGGTASRAETAAILQRFLTL
ncbi:MAG: S-layer homology domain-containing protein [Peptococcaceae bacterium]|jgi:hypothetical protein|nr:S-layer homology domain-containing protein [Peptococcaceae bacterium]